MLDKFTGFHINRLAFIIFALLLSFSYSCKQSPEKKPGQPLLYLPDDLEATLWAESPMFFNPTNMDVDARGRIWITEGVNYRAAGNDTTKFLHHPEGDRIMILEDTNLDGRADKSKLFAEDKDLVSPLGIAVIGNKVYVSCSPNLLVYTDDNGDDIPDKKEIFLTGFGGKDHDHSLHAIVGGPDGRLYFNTGNAGPHVVKDKSGWTLRSGSIYTGGSPYNLQNQGNMISDDGKIWVGGLALRINEDGNGLKVMGHNFRNSYEVAIDSYGNIWQNDNDDEVAACRTSWLMEGGNAGYFSMDGTRTWQADRRPGQDVFNAHWHQDDPGVIPAGDKSGAGAPTGIVVYEGDEMGKQYRGMLLSADAGRNVVFGYHPQIKNSGFDLGKRNNFISSLQNDNENYIWHDSAENAKKEKWFRPSDVTIGTDGAIYVADWYDGVVGGHQMKDTSGYGRIYRITPKGNNLRTPRLGFNTIEELTRSIKSPAINVRYQAFRKLIEKGDEAIGPVKELLKSENPYHQARAVWLLAQLGEKGQEEVQNLFNHPDQLIRSTAIRALRQAETGILPFAEKLSKDSSSFVRRETAIGLQDKSFRHSKPVLIDLAAQFDGTDRWYLEALGAASPGNEEEMYAACLQALNEPRSADQWSERMASIAWRLHPPSSVKDLKLRAVSPKLSAMEHMKAITALGFIKTREAALAMKEIMNSPLKDVSVQAEYWVSFRMSNDWFPYVSQKPGATKPQQANVENDKPGNAPGERVVLKAYSISTILGMKGDNVTGKQLFSKKCASCHLISNEGNDIGPELTTIHNKLDREQLLNAIVDPGAAVLLGYDPWEVKTKNGDVFFGFLIADGKQAIVIKDLAGRKNVISSSSITSRKRINRTVMPEPFALGLTEQNLADLLAFLSGRK